MVLRAGDSYTASNKKTKVIQGEVTQEQKRWWEENHDKPLYKRSYRPSTPAEKLYLALCKNGSMRLQEALGSCGLDDAQKVEAQRALKILDNEGNLQNVNDDGVVTKLTRPSFVDANQRQADLEEADLRGADLRGANLQGANMEKADLEEADLLGAVLWEAKLQGANMEKAKLQGTNLWRAGLLGANLREANLQEADLWRANLQEADLQEADLWRAGLLGANLREANLQGAKLQEADLRGADISGANFEDAKNLDAASIKLAFYCQDNPPKNLEDALNGVDAKQRPMALTSQEYENVCRLRDLNNPLAFEQDLDRLRGVCNKRIDSQQQVDADLESLKDLVGRGSL